MLKCYFLVLFYSCLIHRIHNVSGLARVLGGLGKTANLEEQKSLYKKVIELNNTVHDAYIELGTTAPHPQDVNNSIDATLLIKTTVVQNEAALSYRSVRGLYFLAVVFA